MRVVGSCSSILVMAQEARGREVSGAVAAEIRSIMGRRLIKPVQLADAAGFPRSTMSNLLNGKAAMDLDQLARICRVLGIQPGDVMAAAMGTVHTIPTDPRTQLQQALDNPDTDSWLVSHLSELMSATGLSGESWQQLADEVRQTRRKQLRAALAALPSDTQGQAV